MSLALVILSGMLLIVLSADYFTNGVEWLGRWLGLGDGAVGTLLAAMGTALPETLVPVMAIVVSGTSATRGVGLGAILGAPFMLSTLGLFVIGVGLWWLRRPHITSYADVPSLERDLTFFVAAFAGSLAMGVLPPAWHRPAAILLVLAYGAFAWRVLGQAGRAGEASETRNPPALHLWHEGRPPSWVIVLQVAMALGGLVVGAHYFVAAVTAWAHTADLNGFVLSVVLTPVATELPEVLNSVIWIRRRADSLAFGNVTGALAFQASLVPALGLWFTPWLLTPTELLVGGISLAAGFWVRWQTRRAGLRVGPLLAVGLLYAAFLIATAARLGVGAG